MCLTYTDGSLTFYFEDFKRKENQLKQQETFNKFTQRLQKKKTERMSSPKETSQNQSEHGEITEEQVDKRVMTQDLHSEDEDTEAKPSDKQFQKSTEVALETLNDDLNIPNIPVHDNVSEQEGIVQEDEATPKIEEPKEDISEEIVQDFEGIRTYLIINQTLL